MQKFGSLYLIEFYVQDKYIWIHFIISDFQRLLGLLPRSLLWFSSGLFRVPCTSSMFLNFSVLLLIKSIIFKSSMLKPLFYHLKFVKIFSSVNVNNCAPMAYLFPNWDLVSPFVFIYCNLEKCILVNMFYEILIFGVDFCIIFYVFRRQKPSGNLQRSNLIVYYIPYFSRRGCVLSVDGR